MSRRKGTPCACNSDPCGCGGSKSDCIKTVNNEYPDPNRNLEIKAGPGIQIIPADHGIEIINISDPDAFIAGDNIEIIDNADGTREIRLKDNVDRTGDTDLTGDVDIIGDLSVNGNIVQNGAYYDTHAEHIYSRDDYIIMRDGAVAGLAAGDYSGFQVKLYDGVNDGRLVIDNSGVARVGDVGDEQPLLTRDEAADLTDGDLLKWDAANQKAVGIAQNTFGIPNNVIDASFTNVVITAGVPGYSAKQISIPDAGTYLLNAVIIGSTAMTTGISVKGFSINGSLQWIDESNANGDAQYANITRIVTLPANSTVDFYCYFSVQNITISGKLTAVRLV